MVNKAAGNFPRGVEVVTGIVIENGKGEVLLAKSPKWSNRWVLPGGHVEPGEKIVSAAIREGKEETGLDLKPIHIIQWGEIINPKEFLRPAHLVYFHVYCKVIRGRVRLEKAELTSWNWMKPEAALKLDLAERFDEALRKFILYKKKGRS
jgi:nucleoside triphosphatase